MKRWNVAAANSAECTYVEHDRNPRPNDFIAMKTKRRLLTREELLTLEEQYPCVLGNLLSLGAAHFRPTNGKNGRRPSRATNGAAHRRSRKAVAA